MACQFFSHRLIFGPKLTYRDQSYHLGIKEMDPSVLTFYYFTKNLRVLSYYGFVCDVIFLYVPLKLRENFQWGNPGNATNSAAKS